MKKITRFVVLLMLVVSALQLNAQGKTKLGHISSDSLMKIMPGYDSALTKIKGEVATYQATIKKMQDEYDLKIQSYKDSLASMTPIIKDLKETEIKDLKTRIDKFTASAQDDIQKRQKEVLYPLIEKAKNAITAVAKENNFAYIFDSANVNGTIFLYKDGGEDIMPLVKKKLGIK